MAWQRNPPADRDAREKALAEIAGKLAHRNAQEPIAEIPVPTATDPRGHAVQLVKEFAACLREQPIASLMLFDELFEKTRSAGFDITKSEFQTRVTGLLSTLSDGRITWTEESLACGNLITDAHGGANEVARALVAALLLDQHVSAKTLYALAKGGRQQRSTGNAVQFVDMLKLCFVALDVDPRDAEALARFVESVRKGRAAWEFKSEVEKLEWALVRTRKPRGPSRPQPRGVKPR